MFIVECHLTLLAQAGRNAQSRASRLLKRRGLHPLAHYAPMELFLLLFSVSINIASLRDFKSRSGYFAVPATVRR